MNEYVKNLRCNTLPRRSWIKDEFAFAPHRLTAALSCLNAWNRLYSVVKSMSELTELVALKN